MPPAYQAYTDALVATIQALKAVTVSQEFPYNIPDGKQWDYSHLREAVRYILAAAPGPWIFQTGELHGHLVEMLNGMYVMPHETAWPVIHEMCRDMLGMLDVPYAER